MTERNGKLTRTYTESADLVLVIMNMSQPGRRPEFEAITDLLRRGKPVMVLLTRADDIEKDEVEGCVVEERVMKSDKKRREAAEWVESQLDEILLDTGGELLHDDVQSVSVLYAEENTSQAGLERSGLASLFERLIRVASEQGVAMKRRTPARNLSAFIDAILTDTELDDEHGVGVGRVRDQLTTLLQTIDETIRRLEERGPRAAEDARHEIVPAVEKVVRSLADGKESGSTPLRSECEALASECEKRARDIISRHLQELKLSTISDVQAAVTESVELDVPRGTFVFEEVRRTVHYKAVTRGRAVGTFGGIVLGVVAGVIAGPLGAIAVGASLGGIGGSLAGGMLAGEREVEHVVGVDYNKAAASIAKVLGEEAGRQIDQCVKDLRKRCLLPIRRQASIVENRLRQFEESLRVIQRSLESKS